MALPAGRTIDEAASLVNASHPSAPSARRPRGRAAPLAVGAAGLLRLARCGFADPSLATAFRRDVLEHAFAANQKALNAIPTPFVAPIMFVLDLVCSAGLLLFALANAKVIATLVAVVAVARARRVAKA